MIASMSSSIRLRTCCHRLCSLSSAEAFRNFLQFPRCLSPGSATWDKGIVFLRLAQTLETTISVVNRSRKRMHDRAGEGQGPTHCSPS